MEFVISDVEASDLPAVHQLNESEVPHLGKVDIAQMQWFAANAAYFRVAKCGDRLAAFLIGMRPGTRYASLNYRWFCDRYTDFAYVDRIAVAGSARRHGLASRLYKEFATAMPKSVKIMTCEVNIRPPNESSMRYHMKHGFVQVGTQETEAGKKEVALLEKKL